jgi:lipid A disaccharide synthetase
MTMTNPESGRQSGRLEVVNQSRTSDGKKTIALKSGSRKQELENLLSGITPENMHSREFSSLIGKERW